MSTFARDGNRWQLTMALLAVTGFASVSHASELKGNASIPFANMGGLQDWKADGNNGIYLQSSQRKWYYAQFMGPCDGIQFRERVGFMTEPGGELDHFSAVIVGGRRCYFKSFERSDGPPKVTKPK